MHIAAVESKANELMADLLRFISEGEKLDDFTKARFVKAAKDLPENELVEVILALTYTAAGEPHLAKQHCLASIDNFVHSATFNNCLTTLAINGFSKTLLDIGLEYIRNIQSAAELVSAFEVITDSLPSYKLVSKTLSIMEKCEVQDQFPDMYGHLNIMKTTMDFGFNELQIPYEAYDQITSYVAQIIEENDNLVLNATRMSISHSGDYLSLVYFVEIDSEDLLTADLNWALGDKIIESDLDSLPLVARFEPLRANMKTVRSAYAG